MSDEILKVRAEISDGLDKIRALADSEEYCRKQIEAWQRKLVGLGIVKEKTRRSVDRASRAEAELIQERLYVVSNFVPDVSAVNPNVATAKASNDFGQNE